MSDIELARLMLTMVYKDLTALRGMSDQSVFADSIFGFHVQQTVEKVLKGWLAALDIKYPHTHDINLLLNLLGKHGCEIEEYIDLVEYNIFAVQYRYESYSDTDEPIERNLILSKLDTLLDKVSGIIANAG
ncbi:MAG: HEPN domain-containing protein [Candidatus Auribacterota bacterium]